MDCMRRSSAFWIDRDTMNARLEQDLAKSYMNTAEKVRRGVD